MRYPPIYHAPDDGDDPHGPEEARRGREVGATAAQHALDATGRGLDRVDADALEGVQAFIEKREPRFS